MFVWSPPMSGCDTGFGLHLYRIKMKPRGRCVSVQRPTWLQGSMALVGLPSWEVRTAQDHRQNLGLRAPLPELPGPRQGHAVVTLCAWPVAEAVGWC